MSCLLDVVETSESTTLLTLLPVLFSQPGAGFFLRARPAFLQFRSTTPCQRFIIFEQRGEVFQLSIFLT
ncbi:hypothetical protein C1N58_19080 [Pantoea sp. SGAir0180]